MLNTFFFAGNENRVLGRCSDREMKKDGEIVVLIICHIDKDILGLDREGDIEIFCRYLSRYMRHNVDHSVGVVYATPRSEGEPVVSYYAMNPYRRPLLRSEVVRGLKPVALGIDEFEKELEELVLDYSMNGDWKDDLHPKAA